MLSTEEALEQARREKAINLDNWSRLDIQLGSQDPKVDDIVETVYGLMESLSGFAGKSNIQKKHLRVILLNLYANHLVDPYRYTGFFRRVSNYRPRGRYNTLF